MHPWAIQAHFYDHLFVRCFLCKFKFIQTLPLYCKVKFILRVKYQLYTGVLDADELSTMIDGGGKGLKHQLPGIEEEVYRSMDSISTLASDNLSLECLEAELFDDIRASIQKSNTASNLNNSSSKVSSGKKDSQTKVNSCEYIFYIIDES